MLKFKRRLSPATEVPSPAAAMNPSLSREVRVRLLLGVHEDVGSHSSENLGKTGHVFVSPATRFVATEKGSAVTELTAFDRAGLALDPS